MQYENKRLTRSDRVDLMRFAASRLTTPDEESAEALAYTEMMREVRAHLVPLMAPEEDMVVLRKYKLTDHLVELCVNGVPLKAEVDAGQPVLVSNADRYMAEGFAPTIVCLCPRDVRSAEHEGDCGRRRTRVDHQRLAEQYGFEWPEDRAFEIETPSAELCTAINQYQMACKATNLARRAVLDALRALVDKTRDFNSLVKAWPLAIEAAGAIHARPKVEPIEPNPNVIQAATWTSEPT